MSDGKDNGNPTLKIRFQKLPEEKVMAVKSAASGWQMEQYKLIVPVSASADIFNSVQINWGRDEEEA